MSDGPTAETIQERLAALEPDLLTFFRERTVVAGIDALGACDRCGAAVPPTGAARHVEWHESLTIGFDMLAGLAIISRDRSM